MKINRATLLLSLGRVDRAIEYCELQLRILKVRRNLISSLLEDSIEVKLKKINEE